MAAEAIACAVPTYNLVAGRTEVEPARDEGHRLHRTKYCWSKGSRRAARGTDEEGKGGVVCSRDRAVLLQKLSSLPPRC